MSEEETKFIEFLNFQIIRKNKVDHVIKKIPIFQTQLEEGNLKILKMIDQLEDNRRRELYTMLVQEFHDVLSW